MFRFRSSGSPLRRVFGLLVVGSGVLGCALSPSQVPLGSSDGERTDVYFYGPHGLGGKQLPPEESRAEAKPKPKPELSLRTVASAKPSAETPRVPSVEIDADAGAAPRVEKKYAGRYLGTDTVVIQFSGFPDEPQVDDEAKIDVEVRGEKGVAVTVVDSSQGTPLCTLEGKFSAADAFSFEAGQPCFEDMLGIPLGAELLNGSGKFVDARLTLEFEVHMSFDAPGDTIEGTLSYHFDGERQR
jgi:hypothetical protein